MKRGDFIKGLTGLAGLSVLPFTLKGETKKVYLFQDFVRGFRYYKGPELLGKMQQGDMLSLFRDPENKYDPFAIAVHYKSKKIGYLPIEKNQVISALFDARLFDIKAEIAYLEPEAVTWENVYLAVYIETDTDSDLPSNLTRIEKPYYKSLINDSEEFYDAFVNNSSSDRVYALIHDNFTSNQLNIAVEEDLFILEASKVPAHLNALFQINDRERPSNLLSSGYFKVNINVLAGIPDEIRDFRIVYDGVGRQFWEVVFF